MHRALQSSVFETKRAAFHAWQDRIRNPSLTMLLVLQLFLICVALPLAATGVPITEDLSLPLMLLVLTLVVILSHRAIAILAILVGLAGIAGSVALRQWPAGASALIIVGTILVFSALTWVVAYSLYAPGRITLHRLQGAAVVYLSLATIFAAAFSLLWELVPRAFGSLPAAPHGPHEFVTMLYFSLATITTTGYGDIVPLNPFVRSLANLEAVLGQFYLAVTVARLVTLELADRRIR
jgi:hypothetical protein